MALKKILVKLSILKNIIQKESKVLDLYKKFKNVEFKGNNEVVNSYIEEYTYISKNTIIHNASVGKFCSIGPNVVIGYGDHPTDFLSTSPKIYYRELFNDIAITSYHQIFESNKSVSIGHDVWIGANCYIKNGVSIGDGAIIGAGAIVNKNVEPFTINVGLPSKSIRMRFSEEIIEELMDLKWWSYPIEKIKLIEPYLSKKIDVSSLNIIKDILKANK